MKTPISAGLCLAIASSLAHAAPLGEGPFDLELAPGRSAEACVALAAGASVDWRFTAATPLAFNLHWHQGEKVFYAERHDAAEAAGRFRAEHPATYCLMWTAPAGPAVRLTGELRRSGP